MPRRAIVASAFTALLCAMAVSADVSAADLQKEIELLRARLKQVEAQGAATGRSVFSFKLAGLLSAATSKYAGDFLTADDIAAATALSTACSEDISSLCTDVTKPAAGSPVSAWFPYYIGSTQCLTDNYGSVSNGCLTAAHTAATYMKDNSDAFRLAVKKVGVKDAFETFTSACATEIAAECDENVSNIDPTTNIVVVPWTPFKHGENHGPRGDFGGFRRLRSGKSEGSGAEDESRNPVPDRAVGFVSQLNTDLGECVAAVIPVASETCTPAIQSLTHVAAFVTLGQPHRRALGAGLPDFTESDAPQAFAVGKQMPPPPPDSEEEDELRPPLHMRVPPSENENENDTESTSESEVSGYDSEDSGNEFSGEEEEERGFRGGNGKHGKWGKYWRHHRDDEAGGVVGFALIVAVIVMGVALFRRRRIIRTLTQRIAQLEAQLPRVVMPQATAAYPGVPASGYPVGIPMNIPVASAPPSSASRSASEAVEENATLLQRSAPQVVYPTVYPGHPVHYPNVHTF